MTEEVKNQAAPEATAQQAQQPAADLNISDLAAIRNILEVASQRGAFKAAELESVGRVFNKLSNFLDAATKAQQPEA